MFMDPIDMKKYPKCTKFIQGIEGTLKGQPKVRNAFLEACMADDQSQPASVAQKIATDSALKWAASPRVDVHDGLLKPPVSGQTVPACGYTDTFGSTPYVIITSFWFDAIEFGFDVDPHRARNRLMRTLLHELVHWVRDQASASDQILVGGLIKGQYREAGHVFEEMAFGTANVCTDDEVWAAILSRRT
jgi:Metallopeptidase toxin 3